MEAKSYLQDVEFLSLHIPFVGLFSSSHTSFTCITEIVKQVPCERTYVTALKNILVYFICEKCGTAHCDDFLFNPFVIACVCHVICTERRDS
jgi:hypothetical protein